MENNNTMKSIEVTKYLDKCFKTTKPDGLNGLIELVSKAISEDENIKGEFLVLQRGVLCPSPRN